jgi:hypothetical protein
LLPPRFQSEFGADAAHRRGASGPYLGNDRPQALGALAGVVAHLGDSGAVAEPDKVLRTQVAQLGRLAALNVAAEPVQLGGDELGASQLAVLKRRGELRPAIALATLDLDEP